MNKDMPNLPSAKACACKGCRTCLLCESGKKCVPALESDEKIQKIFYYSKETGLCLSAFERKPCEQETVSNVQSYVGFQFSGVTILDEFITQIEELNLVTSIDSSPWKSSQSGRRKQDYGPKVNFKKRKVKLSSFSGLPSYMRNIIERMRSSDHLRDFDVVEQCNLEYVPERGSQIEAHFDDDWLWGERLVTLNLLSDTWFTMTTSSGKFCKLESNNNTVEDNIRCHLDNEQPIEKFENLIKSNVKVKIPLKRRSLVILSGPARHQWKHAIERKDITAKRCCCTFRELSSLFKPSGENEDVGKQLIEIASSFKGNVVL